MDTVTSEGKAKLEPTLLARNKARAYLDTFGTRNLLLLQFAGKGMNG